jgi:hypothetical protein
LAGDVFNDVYASYGEIPVDEFKKKMIAVVREEKRRSGTIFNFDLIQSGELKIMKDDILSAQHDEMRTCGKCHKQKSISDFHIAKSKGQRAGTVFINSWCKDCHKRYQEKYRSNKAVRAQKEEFRKYIYRMESLRLFIEELYAKRKNPSLRK